MGRRTDVLALESAPDDPGSDVAGATRPGRGPTGLGWADSPLVVPDPDDPTPAKPGFDNDDVPDLANR